MIHLASSLSVAQDGYEKALDEIVHIETGQANETENVKLLIAILLNGANQRVDEFNENAHLVEYGLEQLQIHQCVFDTSMN